MTRVPDRVLQAFALFPFETYISIAMILVGLGSLVGGVSAGASLDALTAFLLFLWELCIIVGGAGVLISLFLRPWAARRLPPVRAQRTLAMLRATEAASCILVATGALSYAVVLFSQGGIRLDGRSFTIAAMLAIAAGYVTRSRRLLKVNGDVLDVLTRFNDARP